MIFQKIDNLHLYTFDTFEEYLDRAANPAHKVRLGLPSYGSGWSTPEWNKQLQYARTGWSDVIQDIEQWRAMAVDEIMTQMPKPDIRFDKTGIHFDIGRVVADDPESWMEEDPIFEIDRAGKGNIVRVVINTASSCYVRTEFHTRRCGVILAMAQLLELMGYYIQFEITTAISVNGQKLEFRTVAKRPGEALNIAVLAYWASEYMERHIDFAICETMTECVSITKSKKPKKGNKYEWYEQVNTNYGSPIGTYDRGDICFDRGYAGDTNWHSDESAKAYIKEQLRKQGLVFEGDEKKHV